MLSFFLSTIAIHAQILKDTASINLIRKGIDYVYDFRFDEAREVYRKLNQTYPGNPVTHLFSGMITYWENYPLLPTSAAHDSYEEDLRLCIDLSEKKNDPDNSTEHLLSNLCARGMLLMFYADNDLSMEVFPLATSTYHYIRQSFNYTSFYPDFFFFTGLYNYYREAYPEAYPIYKALAFLFPKGDKAKGLKELKIAADSSIFLRAESYYFLSIIFLNFGNNFQQASAYSKSLHELYPHNIEYLAEYIKNLLLIKQYDEAEKIIIPSGSEITNQYYQAELSIFNGILMEKKYHDYDQASKCYLKGARDISIFGDYGNEFAAYAYFGLSRISDAKGDKQYKKIYRKLAVRLAESKKNDFD